MHNYTWILLAIVAIAAILIYKRDHFISGYLPQYDHGDFYQLNQWVYPVVDTPATARNKVLRDCNLYVCPGRE